MANFEFTEQSRIDTVWFIGGPLVTHDWMAMVYRDTPEAPWRMTYRFRYYSPESEGKDPFAHKDTFSTYELRPKAPEPVEKMLDAADLLATKLFEAGFAGPGGKIHRIEIKGGMDEFNDIMRRQPFVKMRKETTQ